MLIDQPTSAPSRKIWAVIIAAFVVGGAKQVLAVFAPELADAIPAGEWVPVIAGALAGYFTRERV